MKLNKLFILLSILNIKLHCIDMYFCTAADNKYFIQLLTLIGCIHKTNYENLKEIAVFNLGLKPEQITELKRIKKISIHEIEKINPNILKQFRICGTKFVPGWYAWKPVAIKRCLEMFPYVVWIDAGTTVLKPLDGLFKHIKENGYFLSTMGDEIFKDKILHPIQWGATTKVIKKFELNLSERSKILEQEPLLSGFFGVSQKSYDLFIKDLYEMAKDLSNYEDDGTTPKGFGTGRHDQTLISILAYLKQLNIHKQDHTQKEPMYLFFNETKEPFYITWNKKYVCDKTHIYNSRGDSNYDYYKQFIKYK